MATAQANELYADLVVDFPWLKDIGITPQWIQNIAATSASSTEVLAQIRNSAGYARRFPSIRRDDGSIRMTESQYIQTENSYRSLLRQFGFDVDKTYSTPQSLSDWFKGDIAPDELQDRLQIYDTLKGSTKAQRDAFYIYTGKNITAGDLYSAVVDPVRAEKLFDEYKKAAASVDYATYITRAAQVGKENVVDAARRAEQAGTVPAGTATRLAQMDANYIRQLMDTIHTPQTSGDSSLSLQEMLTAFEDSIIGSAAQNAGLGLPTKERLAAIKAAGIDKARAIEGYTKFGANQSIYNAAVMRARGHGFNATNFEESQFFGNAIQTRELSAGLAQEEAAGKQQGTFRFDENNGRIVQKGFSNS